MFQQPRSVDAALEMMAQPGARLLAGGTDFFPTLGDNPITTPTIDISRVDDLRGIEKTGGQFRIGAAATWSEIVAHPLPRCFDGLKQAAREIGSIQIQNRGTIGGNLCNASPAADSVPPLLALEAEVELISAGGRRVLPLGDFILGNRRTALQPGEMVAAVLVPEKFADHVSTFGKLGARRYLVISIAMIGVTLRLDQNRRIDSARIAIGSCSAVAQRLPAAEAAIIGCSNVTDVTAKLDASVLAPIAPIDDVRATATYRHDAALTLLRRVVGDALIQPGGA